MEWREKKETKIVDGEDKKRDRESKRKGGQKNWKTKRLSLREEEFSSLPFWGKIYPVLGCISWE